MSKLIRSLIVMMAVITLGVPSAMGQVPAPSTTNLGDGFQIGGAFFTPNPGSMNNVTGAPGVAGGGWSNWTYSTFIDFNGSAGLPTQLRLATTIPGSTSSLAALNWNPAVARSWKIISATDTTSVITLANNSTIFDTLGNKAVYETQLNNVFKFQADQWIDATPGSSGPAINTTTTGQFSFTIGDFLAPNAGVGFGGGYSSISLNYTPVPEPTTVLGLASLTLAGAEWLRRRRV